MWNFAVWNFAVSNLAVPNFAALNLAASNLAAFFETYDLWEVFLRFALSILFGGLIGFERETKNKPAGFRTYLLVCIGATMATVTGAYLSDLYPGSDPSRISAQVISGIGFLGAGTIITTTGNKVKGLTTAAGLWATATVGIALGAGFYAGAVIGFLAILFTIRVLGKLEFLLMDKTKKLILYVELSSREDLSWFSLFARDSDYQVKKVKKTEPVGLCMGELVIITELESAVKRNHQAFVDSLNSYAQVAYVEVIAQDELSHHYAGIHMEHR